MSDVDRRGSNGENGATAPKNRRWVVAAVVAIAVVCSAGVAWIGVSGRTYGSDPTIEALLGDPDAALAFLYPSGVVEPGTSPVAIEYIRDRKWNNDGFDTLAQMLDEAATAHRDRDDPLSELSTLAATDTINLLGERGDDGIGDKAYDSLSHLIANYIADLIDEGHIVVQEPELRPDFGWYWLLTVLRQVLGDADAVGEITSAAIQRNGIDVAINAETEDWVAGPVAKSRQLLSYLAHAAGFAELTTPDARSDAMLEALGNSVNLLPRPGVGYYEYVSGADVVDHSLRLPRQNYVVEGSHRTRWDIVDAITMSISYSTGVQLGVAGRLSDGSGGEHYPWFVDGAFVAELALAPENLDAFFRSLQLDPVWGETFTELRAWLYRGDLVST